jgi:hypothetical protein
MEACCEKPENRSGPERLQADLTFTRCKVCNRRHFELVADPGVIGLRGGRL